jgi:hypothetical protein
VQFARSRRANATEDPMTLQTIRWLPSIEEARKELSTEKLLFVDLFHPD